MTRHISPTVAIGWLSAAGLAIVAGVTLISLRDSAYLDTDATQYLSTARNLLDANGVVTDIIYYDEQYAFGTIPAPQTVFPPGLPFILALFLAAGASLAWSSFLAGLLPFCLTGILIYAILRRLSVIQPLAILGTALWFALGLGWASVLLGRAEVPFTLATVASALICVKARRRPGWLLLAGAFAGAALLVRYQGVFFLAALGLWSCMPLLQKTWAGLRQAVVSGASLLAVPALVVGVLAFRNLTLVGGVGGGPVDTVRAGIEGMDLARSVYWLFSEFSGLSVDGLQAAATAEFLVLGGAILLIAWVIVGDQSKPRLTNHSGDVLRHDEQFTLISLAAIYVAVTACALLYLAFSRAGAFLQGRFLVPLAPFVVLSWVIMMDRWVRNGMGWRRVLLVSALVAFHAGILAAQADVLRDSLSDLRSDRRMDGIEQAMKDTHAGITLRDYLLQRVSRSAPLVAEPGQHVWLSLERPVLGATPAGFSDRIWNEQAIRELRACYGAQFVLFFPELFEPDLPHNANKILFIELARGETPGYLRPVLRNSRVELYAIETVTDGVSCPKPRRPA